MDCNDARLLLTFARPLASELEEGEAQALASHLAACPRCAAADRTTRRIDDTLGRAMRAVPMPEGLQQRLKSRLSRERDTWYRKRLLTWTTAAAAVLLIAFFGWNALKPRPIVPDPENWHALVNSLPETAAGVEERYKSLGVTMKAPSQFDYGKLVHLGVADFQGKRVPLLMFQGENRTAWVYVLNDRQFDLKALKDRQAPSVGSFKVQTEWNPADAGYAYICVFTGDNLAPFLKNTLST
jgi:hypothetical protein